MIDWIRSWFCKHEWQFDGQTRVFGMFDSKRPEAIWKTYHCKKCMKRKKIYL